MTWLGNAERIEADAEGIVVSDFIDPETYDAASMPELRRRALAEKNYRDNLISSDGKTVGMLLEMRTYPRDSVEPRSEVTHALREVLAQPEYAGFSIHARGPAHPAQRLQRAVLQGIRYLFRAVPARPDGSAVLARQGRARRDRPHFRGGAERDLDARHDSGARLYPELVHHPDPDPADRVCIGDSMHIIATYNQHRRGGLGVVAALRQACPRRVCRACSPA